MGESLQWFFSTIADLPEGRSAMGGEVCNITPGLSLDFVTSRISLKTCSL